MNFQTEHPYRIETLRLPYENLFYRIKLDLKYQLLIGTFLFSGIYLILSIIDNQHIGLLDLVFVSFTFTFCPITAYLSFWASSSIRKSIINHCNNSSSGEETDYLIRVTKKIFKSKTMWILAFFFSLLVPISWEYMDTGIEPIWFKIYIYLFYGIFGGSLTGFSVYMAYGYIYFYVRTLRFQKISLFHPDDYWGLKGFVNKFLKVSLYGSAIAFVGSTYLLTWPWKSESKDLWIYIWLFVATTVSISSAVIPLYCLKKHVSWKVLEYKKTIFEKINLEVSGMINGDKEDRINLLGYAIAYDELRGKSSWPLYIATIAKIIAIGLIPMLPKLIGVLFRHITS